MQCGIRLNKKANNDIVTWLAEHCIAWPALATPTWLTEDQTIRWTDRTWLSPMPD